MSTFLQQRSLSAIIKCHATWLCIVLLFCSNCICFCITQVSELINHFSCRFFLVCPDVIGPLFETKCSYVEARLVHFLSWTRSQSGTDVGPFSDYPHSEYWAYADYKYIAILFQEQPSMFEVSSLTSVLSQLGCT